MNYKELLKWYKYYRAEHYTYREAIQALAAKYYYSVSYMRKLVTKAGREV
jgi:hypothetical protein